MNLCKMKAALAAAKEFKGSHDRNKALEVYVSMVSQTSNKSAESQISDDIIEVFLLRMDRNAEQFSRALSREQPLSHLLKEADILLSQLFACLRQIRSLSGGCLPLWLASTPD